MQKTMKAVAIKNLQTELKEEKLAEIKRYGFFLFFLTFQQLNLPTDM